ncbi:MAG: DUF427 domain-containing protein [Deltaproteobacteria bacterium]|nr:DUF427 domain-containing protein [Deltaproteobacteria bacterium]
MATATWNGHVLADSDDTIVLEGNHYFPPDAVDRAVLRDSETTSRCRWKGTARYYSLEVGGALNEDAAWSYPRPKLAVRHIKDHIAFWRGVEIEP